MPSSFCKTHSSTLGYSPHLPVSVSGTVTQETRYEAFLGSLIRTSWLALRQVSLSPLGLDPPDLPSGPRTYGLGPAQPIAGWSFTSASPLRSTFSQWFRNVDLISIGYAFRPRLRARLTLSGLTFLRKPWVFGGRVSRPSSRYSFRHNHFCVVDSTLPVELLPKAERSPTRRLSTNPKLRWRT